MDFKEFYFSVEGKTEKIYLKWLEAIINKRHPEKKVKFNIIITHLPQKRIRSIPKNLNVDVFHFCDMESTDQYHQEHFRKTLENLDKAKKSTNVKNYYLAYSNYSFDLWIILHKLDFFSASSHRKNYIRQINSAFNTKFRGMNEFKKEENLKKVLDQLNLEDVLKAIERNKSITYHNQLNGYQKINYKGYNYFRENPSLSVGEIIEKILLECKIEL